MKHVRVIMVLIALAVAILLVACPNPGLGPDPITDGEDLDPVDPATLLQIPDDATPSSGGPGVFYAATSDLEDGSVSLITSSAANPTEIVTIVDGDISPTQPLVRFSDDSNMVAYVNTLDQLIIHDRPSGESFVVRSFSTGAEDMDEFWWYDDHTLLFSSGGSISRAMVSGLELEQPTAVTGSEVCHHDLSLNPFSAFPGGIGIALTHIEELAGGTLAAVWVGDYLDDGSIGQITDARLIASYGNEFGIGFDPMLTWLNEDMLVWRTNETVSTLWFCNVTDYLQIPSVSGSLGWVLIDDANAPTDFILSPTGDVIYLFGRGNVVTSAPIPTAYGDYDAEVFYVDNIEYTVSKLAFSPSGNYFLVGNRSRLRCYDSADPSVRYRWWEDTELEQQLDDVSLELLQIWWK